MKVSIAAPADHASTAEGNKLSVAGIFDTIAASEFPVRHPFMVLALRVRVEWEDQERDHRIRIQLEDEDGRKAFAVQGTLKVGTVEPGEFMHLNQLFEMRDMIFQRPGNFLFRIFVDDREEQQQPIRVVQAGPSSN